MTKYCCDICGKEIERDKQKLIDIPVANPISHDIDFTRFVEVCEECHYRLSKDQEKRWKEFQYKEALIIQKEIRRIRGDDD